MMNATQNTTSRRWTTRSRPPLGLTTTLATHYAHALEKSIDTLNHYWQIPTP